MELQGLADRVLLNANPGRVVADVPVAPVRPRETEAPATLSTVAAVRQALHAVHAIEGRTGCGVGPGGALRRPFDPDLPKKEALALTASIDAASRPLATASAQRYPLQMGTNSALSAPARSRASWSRILTRRTPCGPSPLLP